MDYMYLFITKAMKIMNDYLILLKGEKYNGLYHLIENAIVNYIFLTLMEN